MWRPPAPRRAALHNGCTQRIQSSRHGSGSCLDHLLLEGAVGPLVEAVLAADALEDGQTDPERQARLCARLQRRRGCQPAGMMFMRQQRRHRRGWQAGQPAFPHCALAVLAGCSWNRWGGGAVFAVAALQPVNAPPAAPFPSHQMEHRGQRLPCHVRCVDTCMQG